MGPIDWILLLIALSVPPILILRQRHVWFSCLISFFVFWAIVIIGAQVNASFSPGNGMVATFLSLALGWVPAAIYVACWYSLSVILFDHDQPRSKKRSPK